MKQTFLQNLPDQIHKTYKIIVFLSFCLRINLLLSIFLIDPYKFYKYQRYKQLITAFRIMNFVKAVYFILALLQLVSGDIISIEDVIPAPIQIQSTPQKQGLRSSFSIGQFLKTKKMNSQTSKQGNTSSIINQNNAGNSNPNENSNTNPVTLITLKYEQYLQQYKPEKFKKLNEFKNEKQSSQYLLRRSIYLFNVQYMNKFNQDPGNTYKMGITSYADVDPMEFKQFYYNSINNGQLAILLKDRKFDESIKKVIAQQNKFDSSIQPAIPEQNKFPNQEVFVQNTIQQVTPVQVFDQNAIQKVTPVQDTIQSVTSQSTKQVTDQNNQEPFSFNREPARPELPSNRNTSLISTLIARKSNSFFITKPDNITIDWRNISGKVNFQGSCNACYAFSATDSLYTTLRIRKKPNVQPFSAQEIVSCIKNHVDKSDGCSGGLPYEAYYYINIQGISREKDYPYSDDTVINSDAGICNDEQLKNKNPEYKKNKYILNIFNPVSQGDCREVAKILKDTSLAGLMSNGTNKLQNYKEGVFRVDSVNPSELTHAVAIVGYNHTLEAFIIKNSWDTSWGMKGFGYVHLNTGICAKVYYPLIS